MGKRVCQNAIQLVGIGLVNSRCEQRAGLKRRILRIWQVKDRKLGAGLPAQPDLQERGDRGGSRGPGLHGGFVFRECPDRGVCGDALGTDGDKEAGRFKSKH